MPNSSADASTPSSSAQPQRVILAGRKRLNRKAKLFTDQHADKTLVYRNQALEEVLAHLGQIGITSVLIEGGGHVLGDAFANSLVNEANFYIAPILCGDATTASLACPLQNSVGLSEVEIKAIGDNVKIAGIIG